MIALVCGGVVVVCDLLGCFAVCWFLVMFWFVLFCRCLRGCVLFSAAVVWLDDCCFKDLRCCFDALF